MALCVFLPWGSSFTGSCVGYRTMYCKSRPGKTPTIENWKSRPVRGSSSRDFGTRVDEAAHDEDSRIELSNRACMIPRLSGVLQREVVSG